MSQTGLSVDNSRISPFRETRETFPKRLKTCDRHLSQRRGHRARSGASVAILAGALAREPAPGASKRERSPTSAPRLSPDQRKNPRNSGGFRVRDTGIEPVTSSVSGKRATAAPIAPVKGCSVDEWRWRRDSNPCKRLCRPVPSRSATPPCGLTPRAAHLPKKIYCTRADDETRTRDPHLGKVMRYQLRYIRISFPVAPGT